MYNIIQYIHICMIHMYTELVIPIISNIVLIASNFKPSETELIVSGS